jgi:hypothetical protein
VFDAVSGELIARRRAPGAAANGDFAFAGIHAAAEDTNNMVQVLDLLAGQPKGPSLPTLRKWNSLLESGRAMVAHRPKRAGHAAVGRDARHVAIHPSGRP